MTTLESLQAKIQKLQKQADALVAKQSSGVIEKIRGLMSKHRLTTADIEAHIGSMKRGPKPGAKSAVVAKASVAKYQDPKTGATWSGHGRAPGWIANAKDRTKYLVNGNASGTASVTASKARPADNYVRGPQAPKYRDSKSGATWSGRGPAPAWLSGAKDRTRFLIDGASADVAVTKTGKPKAAAKKAVAKEVVAKKASTAKKVVANKKAPAKKTSVKKVVASKKVVTKADAAVVAPETTVAEAGA